MIYKCRAECSHDITRVYETLDAMNITITTLQLIQTDPFPDVEWTFECAMNARSLKKIIKKIDDAHRIGETLINQYISQKKLSPKN